MLPLEFSSVLDWFLVTHAATFVVLLARTPAAVNHADEQLVMNALQLRASTAYRILMRWSNR